MVGTIGFVFSYLYEAFVMRNPGRGGLFIDMPEPWWDPNLPIGQRILRASKPIWGRALLSLVAGVGLILLITLVVVVMALLGEMMKWLHVTH